MSSSHSCFQVHKTIIQLPLTAHKHRRCTKPSSLPIHVRLQFSLPLEFFRRIWQRRKITVLGTVTSQTTPSVKISCILISALNSIRRDSEKPSPEILYQVLKHVAPLREGCMSYHYNVNFIKSTQSF